MNVSMQVFIAARKDCHLCMDMPPILEMCIDIINACIHVFVWCIQGFANLERAARHALPSRDGNKARSGAWFHT